MAILINDHRETALLLRVPCSTRAHTYAVKEREKAEREIYCSRQKASFLRQYFIVYQDDWQNKIFNIRHTYYLKLTFHIYATVFKVRHDSRL